MTRKLSKTKLKKIKEAYEQKRHEIIAKVEKFNDELELDLDGDDVDVVQGSLISELNSKLSHRDLATLNRLNAALKKIDEDAFGFCDDCDAPIPDKRLLAIPGCTICVSCAEENETASRQFAS